jgi:hypothetical protein
VNALLIVPYDALKTNEKTPEHRCSGVCRLVRLAGIEPTTPWFVAKYSIQLSYSREASQFIIKKW